MKQYKNKRLYRSRQNRKIAGICGGLGDYFGMDPVWARLFFIIFFFLGGSALLIYIIMWIIIPLEPETGTGHYSRTEITNNKGEPEQDK